MRKRSYGAALKPHPWDVDRSIAHKSFAQLTSGYLALSEEVASSIEALPLPEINRQLVGRFDLEDADARILGGNGGIGPVEFSRRTRPGGRIVSEILANTHARCWDMRRGIGFA